MIFTLYDVVLLIALALIFARLFGYIFLKLKLPVVIGELFAGFILAILGYFIFTGDPCTIVGCKIDTICLDYLSFEFDFLAEIGILFLLFISGLSTDMNQIKKMGKPSFFVAIGGITLPLLF